MEMMTALESGENGDVGAAAAAAVTDPAPSAAAAADDDDEDFNDAAGALSARRWRWCWRCSWLARTRRDLHLGGAARDLRARLEREFCFVFLN